MLDSESKKKLIEQTKAARRCGKDRSDLASGDASGQKAADSELRGQRDQLEESVKELSAQLTRANEVLEQEERKRTKAEEELKALELRVRSLIDQTTDAVFCYEYDSPISTDLPIAEQVRLLYDGVLVECNDVCAKSYGAERAEDVIGGKLTELFGAAPGSLDQLFGALVQGGYRIVDGEGVETLEDGTQRHYLNNGHAVIEDGKVIRVWGTFRDVTEHKQAEEELAQGEERFRQIVENIREVFWMENADGTELLYVSPAYEEIWGQTCEEFYRNPKIWIDSIHPDDRKRVEDAFAKGRLDGTYSEEFRIIRPDGSVRWIWDRNVVIRDESGNIRRIAGVAEDITQRKQAEDALRRSEGRYRSVVDNAGEGVAVTQDGVPQFINPRLAAIMGYSQEESTSRPFIDFVHPDDRDWVMDIHTRRIRGEEVPGVYELRVIDQQGNTKWLENNGVLIEWDGRPASLNFLRDITDRKQAEEALRDSERRYETVVKNAGEGIVVVQEGRLQFVNPYVETVFGRTQEEMGSRSFIEFVHPDDRDWVMDIHVKRFRGEDVPPAYELRVIDKRRDTRWLECNGILIEWNGRPATLNFLRDITDRKKTEDALRRSEGQYRRLVDTSPHGIQEAGRDGKIIFANKACHRIYGYEDGELIGKYVWELTSTDGEREQLRELIGRLVDEGPEPSAYLGQDLTKDGRVIDVQVDWDHMLGTDGRVEGFISVITDITERSNAERALQESEEKYRQLFETETDAIMIFDAETRRFIDVNDAAVRLYGYSREEFLSLTPLDISAEQKASETSIKHADEGFPIRIPIRRHKKKDGTVFPVEISGSSFMLNGRKVMFEFMRDITDRKLADDEVDRQRFYLAKAQDMGSIGTWELDIVSNRLVWTDENYRIFGVEVGAELTYEIFLNCVHPEDREYVDQRWKAALNKEPYDIEHRVLIDGKVKWVREKADVRFDKKGIPFLAIGFTQDITENKQAQEALRESEGFLQSVFDGIRDGISILDCDLNIVRVNQWMEQMYDSETQLVGRKCYEVYQGRECLCPWCPSVRAIETGEVHTEIVPFPSAENPAGWMELSAFPLRGADGAVVGVIEHVKDITERKLAERRILENRAQLKSLASQLSRSEERERHRLATALHDQVGQSLVFSKLKLDQLRMSDSGGEVGEALEEVCGQLGQVIQETRTLTFDLSSPILYELGFEAAVAEWLADEIEERHGIETEFCDDGQEKPLDDDIRALLFRNVRELLINVVKHAHAHKVKVEVRRTGVDVCVSVEDDGIGFAPAEVKAVAAKSDKFGLFSIRERLEQLGGLIEIDSGPDQGSRILMKAPLKCETLTDGMEL